MRRVVFSLIACFTVALRPAFRAVSSFVTPRMFSSRSYHRDSGPPPPLQASPGNRLVEIVMFSGDKIVAEVDAKMTIGEFKNLAIEKLNYHHVFESDDIQLVGRHIDDLDSADSAAHSSSYPLVKRSDKATIGQLSCEGMFLQLTMVSPKFPDARRYPWLFMGIESGRDEWLKFPPLPRGPLYDVFKMYVKPSRNITENS